VIQIIQIDPRQLKAIALLAPKTDQRYWLNGVFVEATSTETRLVAMDGKRMGVFLAAKANQLAGAIQASAILPHDALDFVRPSRGRFAQLELRIDPAVPRWAELTHGGTSFQFLTVDGGYPIYRRALGPHRGSGEAGQYDPRHLHDFHRVLEAMEGKLPPDRNGVYLHHNGNENTRVSINGREDFVGTVRPRALEGPAHLPWADSPSFV
jgi:DNA polymerase-3 subunit beta